MRSLPVYLALVFVTLMCAGGSNGGTSPSDASNQITYDGKDHSIEAGLEEVFKPDDNHANSELSITDGEFYSTQVTISGNLNLIWRARDASVWFYAKMYSPGTSGLRAGTFEYVPSNTDEDDPSLAQRFFFKEARFVVDTDNDGDFDSSEYLDVSGGTLTLSGSSPTYTITLGITLENGKTVVGSFAGQFPKV